MDPAVAVDYAAGRCSLGDVARRWAVPRREARGALLALGVTVRPPGRPVGASAFAAVLTADFLRHAYVVDGRSTSDLASEVGCTAKTVARYLAFHGIARQEPSPDVSAAVLRRWYVDEGRSVADIAGRVGCSGRAVRALLAEWDIRRLRSAPSRAELWDAYVDGGRSTTDIAAEQGCAPATIARRLRAAGIPLRRRGGDHAGRAAGIRPRAAVADT
ncbi:MAG TPA: hypothetical protein VGI06_16040 [Acidimicrobiales bacterium]